MILRIVLGVLFLAMAAGQLASLGAMGDIISVYGLTGGAVSVALAVAVALIAGEAVAGVWLTARPRSQARIPVWIFTAVSLIWTVLAAQAFARGLVIDNCGCFGIYLPQPLRWWVLVEDALLLLYAWLLLRGTSRSRARTTARRAGPTPGDPDISSASARNVHRKQDAS